MRHRTIGGGSVAVTRRTYLFGAMGGGIRGYDLGIISGALLFVSPALGLSPSLKGTVVASALMGSIVGAFGTGPVSDRIGRRRMFAVAAVIFVVGSVGTGLAGSVAVLIGFRVLLGVAVGISTTMIPVYLSEIAPARTRGAFAALFQVMITVGTLSAALIAYGLSFDKAWRWMFIIGAAPAILMFVASFMLPESPRWLVRHGRLDEARAVLARSRSGRSLDDEVSEIERVDALERERVHLRQMLRSPQLTRLLLVGIGLGVFQQLLGNKVVTYYAPTVLKQVGFSTNVSLIAQIGFTGLALIMTLVMAFVIIDRIGRRRPLIAGGLGIAVGMILLGIDFAKTTHGGPAGYVDIAGLAIVNVSFALSWGGIMWVLLGELYPLRIRATAVGIATCLEEATSVGTSYLFPVLFVHASGIIFWAFAAVGVLAAIFAARWVPETKGASLEQIELDLVIARPEPPPSVVGPAPASEREAIRR